VPGRCQWGVGMCSCYLYRPLGLLALTAVVRRQDHIEYGPEIFDMIRVVFGKVRSTGLAFQW
jgi:hypothetical protein